MFNDHAFRDRRALSGVNSINWARIMAQIVYYFSSALLARRAGPPVSFTVPTGNFGDIFAGYAAKRWACRSTAGDRHQRQRHSRTHARNRRL
jgi:threonine synthase